MVLAEIGQLNLQEIPSDGSRTVDCFEKLQQIGEGTYAQVFMAKEIQTGEIVALKKVRLENEKEGFPITALREIKILNKLHHENIIKLKEIVTSSGPEKDEQETPADNNDNNNIGKGVIYMVFEYMDHDLSGLVRRAGKLSVVQIKCYMKQLLTGLHYCHVNQVLHRDIKGANLLIDNNGTLKLADFGLARFFANDHKENLSNRVITLWYRPPELLLGSTKYGPAVDMWSVGCVFAQLLEGKALFPGKDEAEQIYKIFELCGTPDESCWPGITELPWYDNFKSNRPLRRRFREHFRHLDRHAFELLEKMLILDPEQRISAFKALDAEYFWTDPMPCDPKSLPKYESSHGFRNTQKRHQQRQQDKAAKRQKFQHPKGSSCMLPFQQSGEDHAQEQAGPNLPIPTGPGHHNVKPHGHSIYTPRGRGHNRPYRGSQGGERGGFGSVPYLQHVQGPVYGPGGLPGTGLQGAGSNVYEGSRNYQQDGPGGLPGTGLQGGESIVYEGSQNYQQDGLPFDGSGAGRGSNMTGGKRDQQHGEKQ